MTTFELAVSAFACALFTAAGYCFVRAGFGRSPTTRARERRAVRFNQTAAGLFCIGAGLGMLSRYNLVEGPIVLTVGWASLAGCLLSYSIGTWLSLTAKD